MWRRLAERITSGGKKKEEKEKKVVHEDEDESFVINRTAQDEVSNLHVIPISTFFFAVVHI